MEVDVEDEGLEHDEQLHEGKQHLPTGERRCPTNLRVCVAVCVVCVGGIFLLLGLAIHFLWYQGPAPIKPPPTETMLLTDRGDACQRRQTSVQEEQHVLWAGKRETRMGGPLEHNNHTQTRPRHSSPSTYACSIGVDRMSRDSLTCSIRTLVTKGKVVELAIALEPGWADCEKRARRLRHTWTA